MNLPETEHLKKELDKGTILMLKFIIAFELIFIIISVLIILFLN